MPHSLKLLSIAVLSLSVGVPLLHAAEQGVPVAAQITQPANGVMMHHEYAKTIARMANLWGWPMVNMLNRNDTITKAPHPGLLGGILPVAPRGQLGMLHDYASL